METERKFCQQSGPVEEEMESEVEDVISMADSTIMIEDIEGELTKIERLRDVLVRRESELRYMMDDMELCREISRLKSELQKLVSLPETEKTKEERQQEDKLLQQIHKLVETRDFLVEDMEFERLREREEDRDMAAFLQSKFPKTLASVAAPRDPATASTSLHTSAPRLSKTRLSLMKECCGFTCSIM